MRALSLAFLVAVCAAICGSVKAEVEQRVLFSKRLAEELELIVRQVAAGSANDLAPIFGDLGTAEIQALQIVLKSPNGNMVLASRLWFEPRDRSSIFHNVVIINCILDDREVLLPIAIGPRLGVWRIRMNEMLVVDDMAWLDGWQVDARSTKLDLESVSVRARRGDNGAWLLEVADLRNRNGKPAMPPIVFEEQGYDWQFKVVKRWDKR